MVSSEEVSDALSAAVQVFCTGSADKSEGDCFPEWMGSI